MSTATSNKILNSLVAPLFIVEMTLNKTLQKRCSIGINFYLKSIKLKNIKVGLIIPLVILFLKTTSQNNSPVLHLTFDNGNIQDISGNRADATNYGGVFVADRFGNPNSAIFLNNGSFLTGSSDYLPMEKSPRTLCAWINVSFFTTPGIVFGYGDSSYNSAYGMIIESIGGFNNIAVFGWGNDCNYQTNFPTTNKWFHIATTFDSSIVQIFVNGNLVLSLPKTWSTNFGKKLYSIGNGSFYWSSANPFNGFIDDIRVYNTVLSNNEILNLFSAPSNVGTNDSEKIALSYYPNPTKGDINIDFDKQSDYIKITIKNILSEIISTQNFTSTKKILLSIDGDKGIYFIEMTNSKNQTHVLKVLKN